MPARKTEVKGRAGKQPDGSAKTREAKIAVVWSAETHDPKGRPVRDHVKHYKENKRERFLWEAETERLSEVLREAESEMPSAVAACC